MRDGNGRPVTARDLELSNDLATLRAEFGAFKILVDEREDHAAEMRRAQDKAVDAAFAASEKAIVKQEEAQAAYNNSHNDLLRKQDAMIPRHEFDAMVKGMDGKFENASKEIASLRESRSELGGKDESTERGARALERLMDATRSLHRWIVGLAVVIVLGVAAMILK